MIAIIDFGSRKTTAIAKCIKELGFYSRIFDWNNLSALEPERTTGMILSGAPVLLTEVDPEIYLSRFAFLKEYEKPILGICFGHQLLGLLYGARIYKGEEARVETEIKVLKENKLLEGSGMNVMFLEDHTEGITLPVNFICFASSAKYEVEGMKHPYKDIFGVQFHPEASGENGMKVLANFCKLTKSI